MAEKARAQEQRWRRIALLRSLLEENRDRLLQPIGRRDQSRNPAEAHAPQYVRPVAALLLGRLAVDRKHHNQGLGSGLLRDAMLRSFNIARDAGVFAMLVHALHDQARQFYLSRGFVQSPLQPMTLMMTMATVQTILTEPDEGIRVGHAVRGS